MTFVAKGREMTARICRIEGLFLNVDMAARDIAGSLAIRTRNSRAGTHQEAGSGGNGGGAGGIGQGCGAGVGITAAAEGRSAFAVAAGGPW